MIDKIIDESSRSEEPSSDDKFKKLNTRLQTMNIVEREEILDFLQGKVDKDCG